MGRTAMTSAAIFGNLRVDLVHLHHSVQCLVRRGQSRCHYFCHQSTNNLATCASLTQALTLVASITAMAAASNAMEAATTTLVTVIRLLPWSWCLSRLRRPPLSIHDFGRSQQVFSTATTSATAATTTATVTMALVAAAIASHRGHNLARRSLDLCPRSHDLCCRGCILYLSHDLGRCGQFLSRRDHRLERSRPRACPPPS